MLNHHDITRDVCTGRNWALLLIESEIGMKEDKQQNSNATSAAGRHGVGRGGMFFDQSVDESAAVK